MQFLTTDYKSGAGVDMGLGTVPPYMTTAVKHGGHRSHKGHSRRSVHSDGSDSYVEMDEWIEETKSAKKKLSKRRRNSRSHPHRKHKQERNPIKHPPKLPIPTPVAAPYIEPMATGASKPTRATVPEPVFVTTSQEMSLGEFVSKHQQEFPVRVRVSRGFYGTSDRWSISEGELFNIHFVKYTKVVAATDGGQHYNIPINSAAEFANIYAPDQDFEVALKGYTFKTVRDIISQNNMPHIVRATEASGRPKVPESSVEKNEMLILKKVKKPIFGSHSLQCTNPITGQHKCLPATCAGNFKTQPLQVCLFLPEVIEHITLPEKFLIFINPDLSSDIPEDLFSTPITLSHCSIETSLVATQLDVSNTNDRTRQSLLEIPIDLDIGVELVTPREDEIKQLYTDTQTIYDNFTGSSIKKIPFNAASGDVNPNVSEAFTAHRRGKENIGIRLQQPPRFANTTAVRNPSHPHPPEPLEPVLSRKKSDKGSRYSKFYKYPPKETEGTILTMEEQIQALQRQVKTLTSAHHQLQELVDVMRTELNELQHRGIGGGPPLKLPPKPKPKRPPPQTQEEMMSRNREYLASLSMPQVMEVLRKLEMPQYQGLFHKRRIGGCQLAAMSKQNLKLIGIHEEHCDRLMNVITGWSSMEELLED